MRCPDLGLETRSPVAEFHIAVAVGKACQLEVVGRAGRGSAVAVGRVVGSRTLWHSSVKLAASIGSIGESWVALHISSGRSVKRRNDTCANGRRREMK